MCPSKTSKVKPPVALEMDGGGKGSCDVVFKSMEVDH